MNHTIILDESKLRDFVSWLPDLERNEKFFVCLQARKKYCPEIGSSDKLQIKRFMATKENLVNKIRQLECPIGSYTTNSGMSIPNEALAIYITPNPRDTRKAAFETIRDLATKLESKDDIDVNPYTIALSNIHRAKARSCFVHFDLDSKDAPAEQIKEKINSIIGSFRGIHLIETRGGYHILVEPDQVVSQGNWYYQIKNITGVDQSGDLMIPIPGCNQGGFIPKFA